MKKLSHTARVAGCQGKVPFISRALADMARGRTDIARNVYRCIGCGAWHLGTPNPVGAPNTRRSRISALREQEAYES